MCVREYVRAKETPDDDVVGDIEDFVSGGRDVQLSDRLLLSAGEYPLVVISYARVSERERDKCVYYHYRA